MTNELDFDEATHTYTIRERVIPSVTQILRAEGFHNPFVEDEHSAKWGAMAHRTAELYFKNMLDSYDSAFQPWMRALISFRDKYDPLGRWEERVYARQNGHEYAGTLDFIGVLSGKRYLIDLKFWAQKSRDLIAVAGLQTAAYLLASDMNMTDKRAVLWVQPEKYELIPLKNPSDFVIWQCALQCYWWKKVNLNRKD